MFAYLRDVWALAQGYPSTRVDLQAAVAIKEAADSIYALVSGNNKSVGGTIKDSAKAISLMTGIPVYTILRDMEAAWRNSTQLSGSATAEYAYTLAFYDVDRQGNAGKFYDVLFKAYNGDDTEAYNMIYDDLIAKGFAPANIRSAMEARIKKDKASNPDTKTATTTAEYILESYANIGYPVSWTENIPEDKLDSYHRTRGNITKQITEKLEANKYYKGQPTGVQSNIRRDTLDYAAALAQQQAIGEKLIGWRSEALRLTQAGLVTVDKFILAKQINSISNGTAAFEKKLRENSFTNKEINAILEVYKGK